MDRRDFIKLSAVASVGFCLPGKTEEKSVPILRYEDNETPLTDYHITKMRLEGSEGEMMKYYVEAVGKIPDENGRRVVCEAEGYLTNKNIMELFFRMQNLL